MTTSLIRTTPLTTRPRMTPAEVIAAYRREAQAKFDAIGLPRGL